MQQAIVKVMRRKPRTNKSLTKQRPFVLTALLI